MRIRAGAFVVSLLFVLPAAPALGAQTFSWDFARDLGNAPGGLQLTVTDNEPGSTSTTGVFAQFPSGMTASGTPSVVGDANWSCNTGFGQLDCTNYSGGTGLTPGHSIVVTGFSVSPTMPDDGGSQVHFQIQHVGSPAEDAGVGAGPPDPCPKNAAPAHVPANPGSSRDPLKRFLTQAHRDLLGRAPTKDEVKYLHSVLESGAATRYQVALAILSSPEYRTKLARNILKEFFRRGATPAEASSGKNQLGAHSDEAYKAVLMGSQEYFTKCSHSDDESFVQHVYRDLLHREVDPGALTAEMNKLKNGESRETIVIGLLSSDEYFGRTIRQLYKDLLNRDPTPAELAASRSKLKSGGSVEQLKANLMGSAEYYFGRTGVNPFFEHPKVNLAKHRVKVTMLRKGIFRLVVQKVKSGHTTLKATTLEPTKLEIPNLVRVGVVNFGELGKGQQRKGWDGTIKGKQLKPGNYLLVPEVVDPHGHLLYIIAPAALKVKEKGNR